MFTWKALYREIANKLVSYEERNHELVELMMRLHGQGLKVSSVSDEDPKGTKVQMSETDPFSFMANFNRGVTDNNRIAILSAIKDEWGLTAELPSDFDGIPLMNSQSSWFMPYKFNRKAEHIPTLWQFFKHVLAISQHDELDTDLFDACTTLKRVGTASLTMGMFWCSPDIWISVDKKNRGIAEKKGIDSKITSGADYVRWLGLVKKAFPVPTVEFSHQAHLDFIAVDPEEEDASDAPSHSEDPEYWLLAPGQGAALWDEWYEDGIGAIGWVDMGDLSGFESKRELAKHIPEQYPDRGPAHVAMMLWDFYHEMKPGDVVFAKRGLHTVCGWGIVTGEYEYDESREPYHSIREIEWQDFEEVSMPTGVQLPLKTLTRMTAKTTFLDSMAEAYEDVPGLDKPRIPSEGRTRGTSSTSPNYLMPEAMNDLFMPEDQVQLCVDLLERKKNLVLQGAPGTGKTFVAKRLAYLLMGRKDNSRVQMVQFHQSMSYEDFVQGFKPSGEGGFYLQDGSFHQFVQAALASPDQAFVFIIDEINRGNLSKVFGELMMLIEPDKRSSEHAIPLSYTSDPEDTFYVPPNVHLIGTMNTADRSLSMVDYALRRRFAFVELEPGFQSPVFSACLKRSGASDELVDQIRQRMKQLNHLIAQDETNLGRGYQIGHSFFVPNSDQEVDQDWLNQILKFEIKPLIEEYYCDDPSQRQNAIDVVLGGL